jgi:RHS repeat-associated protein
VDTNITVLTTYNADGNTASITALNSNTGSQTTQYVYGTTLENSDIASSLLKRAEVYPDSIGTSDRVTFKYNRQGQVTEMTDQNATVHAYDYDGLGRQTHDRVTNLGSGVDGAVRRISSNYEVRGMREKLTSYDNAAVGSGSIVNECQYTYNDFGQLATEYQQHGGGVNVSTSPKVQYGYANGSANTIRPTSLVYPDGRELNYDYGSGGSMSDALSRVASLVDDDGTTHLADYQYLGLRSFVEVDYTQPDLLYTLVGTAGGDDPDTGDIYRGLDRFGRIKDSYWRDYGSSSDADRIKYGYDRNGNRTWRENPVATAHSANYDELYFHDLIDRLKHLERGQLNAQKDGVTNLSLKQCWGLDETGNWRRFLEDDNGDNTWDLNQTRTDNTANEITGFSGAGTAWPTPVYDPAGNMTTLPKPSTYANALTAKYDAWNRLVELKEGANTTAQYEYDGAKRRIIKKTYTGGVLSETRHCYFTQPSKWQVIEERVGSSTDAERQFVWGLRYVDDLVLRDRDTDNNGSLDERFYGLQDANWNLTSIADTSGDIQERYQYDAYGWALNVLTASFGYRGSSLYDWETRYAGYRFDKESFLYCVRNRMYAPKVGWVQRDTLGHAAGVNLYAYCFGAPLVSVDPSGRIAITLAGGVVIVLIIAVGFVAIYELFKPGTPLQESCSACIDQTLQAGSTGIKNLLEAIVAAGCAILFQCALHLTDENNCIYYCPDLDEYFEMDPITGECPEIIEWYSNDPPWRGM